MTKENFAVSVHIYYIDQLDYLLTLLTNINKKFYTCITCISEFDKDKIDDAFSSTYLDYDVIVVENIGMDVFPFLVSLKNIRDRGFDYVCKIHTKNTKSPIRKIQRDLSVNSVLFSENQVSQVIEKFNRNSSLGLIGSGLLFRSINGLMYGNRDWFSRLCTMLDLEESIDSGFFAGTMFWARLEPLLPILKFIQNIRQLFENEEYETGGDGTLAHALERFIAYLILANNYEVAFYDPILSEDFYDNKLFGDYFINSGPTEMLGRLLNLKVYKDKILESKSFDINYYNHNIECSYKFDAINHYILIGEIDGLLPNPRFDPKVYRLFYSKNKYSVDPTFYQFLVRENISSGNEFLFDRSSISRYIKATNLFDLNYYRQFFSVDRSNNEYINFVFDNYHHLLNRMSSALASEIFDNNDNLYNYYRVSSWNAFKYLDMMQRAFDNGDYKLSSFLADKILEFSIPTQQVFCCSAISKMRLNDWLGSLIIWKEYFRISKLGVLSDRFKWPEIQVTKSSLSEEATKSSNKLSCRKNKVCVYTALYGDFDELLPPLGDFKDVEFVCFTDKEIDVKGWRVITRPGYCDDNNLNAKVYKILPHLYLQDYDYSLFVDANTLFTGNPCSLIENYLLGNKFVMWRHPERKDVYTEAEVILQILRHEPESIIRQISDYHEAGMESDIGMFEGSFIWREHKRKEVIEFMNDWWEHIERYSKRDQLSLAFLSWQKNFKPKLLPQKLGTSRKNYCFEKLSHKKLHFSSDYANEANEASSSMSNSTKNPSYSNIVFVYNEKYAHTGSTVMRGAQLSLLCKNLMKDSFNIFYTSLLFSKNSVLFLTKGFLKEVSVETLDKLKKDGNKLLFDFVDDKPREDILPFCDGLIASSISSYLVYKKKYSNNLIFLVTHHVDPRVRSLDKKSLSEFSACYAGELLNTYSTKSISDLVNFIHVDTSTFNDNWLTELPNHNFHYAIRKRRGIDGEKPFLKGFTAASLMSNILIQRSEQEALYYLSEDYPYIYDGKMEPESIANFIHFCADSYGSKMWYEGLDIMKDVNERCSDKNVVNELEYAVSCL